MNKTKGDLLSYFTKQDFQGALDRGMLRQTRILTLSMAGAPLVYIAMGAWSLSQNVAPQFPDPLFMGLLGMVAYGELVMAWWMPRLRRQKTDMKSLAEQGMVLSGKNGARLLDRADIMGALLKQEIILRNAMIEAVAVQALLVAFMGTGAGRVQPLYYLSLLPCLGVSVALLVMLPTESSLRIKFEQGYLNHPTNKMKDVVSKLSI